jgi:alkanesulfonate monooxygenase SsuD/methylene tetrahydromethanopterin reductase-like flavin-dependent oxidoreductase (luciferase family)
MTGPKTLAEHIGPTLRQAAVAAGRPETAVRVVAALPVSVTDDIDGARARAPEQFAVYEHLPSYPRRAAAGLRQQTYAPSSVAEA